MHCAAELTDGHMWRAAGVTGVAVGSILGTLNNAPLLRFTAASTASFVLLMGCFSGALRAPAHAAAAAGFRLSFTVPDQRPSPRICCSAARDQPPGAV